MSNELLVLGIVLLAFLMGLGCGIILTTLQGDQHITTAGVLTLKPGARLQNLALENVTIWAQDDNYTMLGVSGRYWRMYFNGTQIR
jgi:hypothetical protein